MRNRSMRLTELDRDIWRLLWARFEEGRGSPSVRELAHGCYTSHSKVLTALVKLEIMGYVTWAWLGERRAARGCLTVTAPDDELARIDRVEEVEREAARAARAAAQREAAKLRMRRVRARKKGKLISSV